MTRPQVAESATRPVVQGISSPFAENPRLAELIAAFAAEKKPSCAFASMADLPGRSSVESEICRQMVELLENGESVAVRSHHHRDAAWESPGDQALISMKNVARCAGAIKRMAPDSISMITVAPVPADVGWNFAVLVSTLEVSIGSERTFIPLRRIAQTSSAAHGRRPDYAANELHDIGSDDVRRFVRNFFGMPENFKQDCARIARELQHPTWRGSKSARQLGLFSVNVMTPMKKAIFAAGRGEVMLKIALARPLADAVAAKKAGALERDEIGHLLWEDAYRHGRPKPPFVKI